MNQDDFERREQELRESAERIEREAAAVAQLIIDLKNHGMIGT